MANSCTTSRRANASTWPASSIVTKKVELANSPCCGQNTQSCPPPAPPTTMAPSPICRKTETDGPTTAPRKVQA